MVDSTKKILANALKLQEDFDGILGQYAFLKRENEVLQNKIFEMSSLIEEHKLKISDLERQIEHIKVAKNIVGSKNNKESKKMLDELIKQIDACIEVLT